MSATNSKVSASASSCSPIRCLLAQCFSWRRRHETLVQLRFGPRFRLLEHRLGFSSNRLVPSMPSGSDVASDSWQPRTCGPLMRCSSRCSASIDSTRSAVIRRSDSIPTTRVVVSTGATDRLTTIDRTASRAVLAIQFRFGHSERVASRRIGTRGCLAASNSHVVPHYEKSVVASFRGGRVARRKLRIRRSKQQFAGVACCAALAGVDRDVDSPDGTHGPLHFVASDISAYPVW